MKNLFLALSVWLSLCCAGSVHAQLGSPMVPNGVGSTTGGPIPALQSILCTTNGSTTTCGNQGNFTCTVGAAASCTVPSTTTGIIYVDGCAAGGGNGLGQASAGTAGGGGGGGGECLTPYPVSVTSGQTLSITVGAGVANNNGGNTSMSGASTPFKTLVGGLVGAIGTSGTGGTGGNGRGGVGGAGGTAGNSGTTSPSTAQQAFECSGAGGGGGGNTAGNGGAGGSAGGNLAGAGPMTSGPAGVGNGAGGGGGASCYGNGGVGGAATVAGSAPTIGFGGGAGGNGTNSSTTVAGTNGFLRITGYW